MAQLPSPPLKSSHEQSGYLHITGKALPGMSPICMQGGCMWQRAPKGRINQLGKKPITQGLPFCWLLKKESPIKELSLV